MVRDSLNSNRFSTRRRPLTVRRHPPGTSRSGRPIPIGPDNPMPEVIGGRECVPDETTWRHVASEVNNQCELSRLEDGCCVLQHGRDVQLVEMYKHFIDHKHISVFEEDFEDWVRNLDGLENVSRATASMSSPDFLYIPRLVSSLESCGTSIDVMVDHTVDGDVMPFKFTNLFLGNTRYIGKVERSDPTQSVARTVMDVQQWESEIYSSQYENPPVEGLPENPALIVSLINITPILPVALTRHVYFHDLATSFVTIINIYNTSGNIISPSSFKYELGKDFETYFEHIPEGYQRLLPENIGQATQVASELKDRADEYPTGFEEHYSNTRLETSASAVAVVYNFAYNSQGQQVAYLVKITLWPLVCVETQNISITGQFVANAFSDID